MWCLALLLVFRLAQPSLLSITHSYRLNSSRITENITLRIQSPQCKKSASQQQENVAYYLWQFRTKSMRIDHDRSNNSCHHQNITIFFCIESFIMALEQLFSSFMFLDIDFWIIQNTYVVHEASVNHKVENAKQFPTYTKSPLKIPWVVFFLSHSLVTL